MSGDLIEIFVQALISFDRCVATGLLDEDDLEAFLDAWFTVERFFRERERMLVN